VEILHRYIEEIKHDLVVNDFNLKEVQLRLPARKHFWVARLIDAKIKRENLLRDKRNYKKEVSQRIIELSPVKITTQTADIAAEQSKEMEDINTSIKEYDYIIEYLEKVEKIFASMHWEIRNIIQINQSEQN
jgi:DNA-dependent RNA polymerase auxiliary subunit epsilon